MTVVGMAGTAIAADLRVKAPIAAPAPFNWSGCYIGGYVGGAWHDRDGATFTDLGNSQFGAFAGGLTLGRVEGRHSWSTDLDSSVIGGGTVGCNWQAVGSPFVFGIEGEAGYMKLEGSAFDPLINATLPVTALRTTPDVLGSAKIGDWYGMVTGRLGYAFDRTLLYVKGGAAFVPVRSSVVDTCLVVTAGCGNWIISTSGKETVTTWTIGGGVEWAVAGNWSIKGEYMFIGLGHHDALTTCGTSFNPTGTTPGGPFCFTHEFGGVHTAKIGVNYRFDS